MSDGPEYDVDFRAHPDEYEIGRGEEGVFKIQPYKDELLGLWGFADRETANEGGEAIYEKFREYRAREEFVGMDMARKYLQMGYTRAMRYARYPGGKKYDDSEPQRASKANGETTSENGSEREPQYWADHEKREAALVYEVWWQLVEADETYEELKAAHRARDTDD